MEFKMSRNRDRIEAAFAELEERGIIARADFQCCVSCASSAMEAEVEKWQGLEPPFGYVFFHEQATDGANEGGSLWLGHGSLKEAATDGNDPVQANDLIDSQEKAAEIIVQVLRERGFVVDWDGNVDRKIAVEQPRGGWDLDYDRETDEDEDDECSSCGGPLSWDGVCADDCDNEDEDEDEDEVR
jgi:hypothetical protein